MAGYNYWALTFNGLGLADDGKTWKPFSTVKTSWSYHEAKNELNTQNITALSSLQVVLKSCITRNMKADKKNGLV